MSCPMCGGDVPPSRGPLPRLYCSKRCNNRARHARKQAARFERAFACLDPSDYVPVADLAAQYGVDRSSLRSWFERHGVYRRPYYLVYGNRSYVRFDVAERYAQDRAPSVPRDWVSVKRLMLELEYNDAYRFIRNVIQRERLPVRRCRNQRYVPPDAAALIRQRWRETLPLPGWLPMARTARSLGATPDMLYQWLVRKNCALRRYRDTETGRPVIHCLRRDLERYLAVRRGPLREAA